MLNNEQLVLGVTFLALVWWVSKQYVPRVKAETNISEKLSQDLAGARMVVFGLLFALAGVLESIGTETFWEKCNDLKEYVIILLLILRTTNVSFLQVLGLAKPSNPEPNVENQSL